MNVSGTMQRVRPKHMRVLAAVVWLALAARVAVGRDGGQQNQQQSQQPCPAQTGQTGQNGQNGQQPQQPQNGQPGQVTANSGANCNNQPAPLFGGSLSIKKSNQSTDAAALGFNGVDPNGQVQQAFLNAEPTPQSVAKAQAMAGYRPTDVELTVFEMTGGLTQGTLPATAGANPPSPH